MAEMDTSSGGGKKKGGKRSKKLSTRIDLTPMVDLGFLLITFFIFTTTMSKPKTMDLTMPKDDSTIKDEDKNKVKASTALTVLLSRDHRVYHYRGIGDNAAITPDVKVGYFRDQKAEGSIRKEIIALKKDVKDLIAQGVLKADDKPVVLIKPDTNSKFTDLISMLDEMTINDITTYAVVDIGTVDRTFIKVTEEANGIK
jgi:biopolymer transport protein ExbD